ncbi:Transcription initiation factor TFIID subunit 13 [Camellia lanceoleosa]|uniref:Transcription initiation factor TFIID subunit 13 n=1 Tax=Camellia lanceoleosa TaxID=1840588 RepID=A0ACC0G7F6_9ERIC|nr:Transcription initiation factor TFIID subunit 13 [Camellia lanceoleosa]
MNNSFAGPSSKARARSSQPSESTFKRKRGVFQKDCELLTTIAINLFINLLSCLVPLPKTVMVEDIVVEYVHKAQDTASKRGKLLIDDFTFLIRKLKQARKAFEVNEEKLATIE